ncbi:MAG: class I SAM-dependent methyltransferase [Candidatus Doudnabacteria bacterium]|nr:class I SAM-dependent methyltransferase [Candidatus Doudnabacteria bacterium]
MRLTIQQQEQVLLQVAAHKHQTYTTDIHIANGFVLNNFIVLPNVLRPEVMSALQLAQWLYSNKNLYQRKRVIDVGCGTGIQGIVVALRGAEKVTCTDIAPEAVENTRSNINAHALQKTIAATYGDLFQNITHKADVIIFNHPFFSDGPLSEQINTVPSQIHRGLLIHRFLENAKQFLLSNGCIIMPYYHFAGPINDPGVQAPLHGFKVKRKWHKNIQTGLQKGWHSIYEISL